MLVRAIGPGLAAFDVQNTLQDPQLSLFGKDGERIAANDNWETGANTAQDLTAATAATGAFTLKAGSKDAALLITLAPGYYTAHVSGVDGGVGVGLIEIYEIPSQ